MTVRKSERRRERTREEQRAIDESIDEYGSPDEKWTPVHGIRTIAMSVISMLNDPNTDSPANIDASNMFKNDREGYNEKVVKLAMAENKLNCTVFNSLKEQNLKNRDVKNRDL